MTEAIALSAEVVSAAMPYVIAFSITRIVVNMFLSMAFKGRVEL